MFDKKRKHPSLLLWNDGCFLNVFQEKCHEDRLADESVLELHVSVFAREEVVEEEMDFAEHPECFGVENVAQSNKEVWKDASTDRCGKGEVRGVCSYKEHRHYHVHRHDAVYHHIRHGKLSAFLVDAEQVGKLVVPMGNHVYQEMRRGSKAEAKDRISDRATDCSADGRVGCKRHNAGMIAQIGILGQV